MTPFWQHVWIVYGILAAICTAFKLLSSAVKTIFVAGRIVQHDLIVAAVMQDQAEGRNRRRSAG